MTEEQIKQKARDFVKEYLRDNLILDEDALTQFATEVTKGLQEQIEKMKCCENCKHYVMNGKKYECERLKLSLVVALCHNKDKWELAK